MQNYSRSVSQQQQRVSQVAHSVKKLLTTCGDNQRVESWKQKEQPSFYFSKVKAIRTFSFFYFFLVTKNKTLSCDTRN